MAHDKLNDLKSAHVAQIQKIASDIEKLLPLRDSLITHRISLPLFLLLMLASTCFGYYLYAVAIAWPEKSKLLTVVVSLLSLLCIFVVYVFRVKRHPDLSDREKRQHLEMSFASAVFVVIATVLATVRTEDWMPFGDIAVYVMGLMLLWAVYYWELFTNKSPEKIVSEIRRLRKDLRDNLEEFASSEYVASLLHGGVHVPAEGRSSIQSVMDEQESLVRLELLTKCRRDLSFGVAPRFFQHSRHLFDDMKHYQHVVLLGDLGYLYTPEGVRQLLDLINQSEVLQSLWIVFTGGGRRESGLDGSRFATHLQLLLDNGISEKSFIRLRDTLSYSALTEDQFSGIGLVVLGENKSEDGLVIPIHVYGFIPAAFSGNDNVDKPWRSHPFVLSWPVLNDGTSALHSYLKHAKDNPARVKFYDGKKTISEFPETLFGKQVEAKIKEAAIWRAKLTQ
jgi:hypothetical protein